MKEDFPEGKFVPIECDLQSFESVKKIKSKYSSIYCLACYAGTMATPDRATFDGYDTKMQTNHRDARIVTHSSLGRDHWDTPNKGLAEEYFGKNGGNLGGEEVKMMGGGC